MLKTPFFIFALLLVVFPATGSTFVKSHEEFVLMPKAQQDEFIIKTMELVVEMETKYQYETAKHGFDLERYRKYVDAIKKIKSFLISDAYAETRGVPSNSKTRFSTWADYARSFSKLSGSQRDEFCVFAGWVSKPVQLKNADQTSKTICSHPDFLLGDGKDRNTKVDKSGKPVALPEWTKGYPDPKPDSGCGKDDRTKIQCNPAIFGFKESAKGSLFCVNASNGAHNSAYFCMKKALDNSSSHEGDSPEVRLAALRKNLVANPQMFESIQNFIYRTCVCERDDMKKNVKGNFSVQYHNYIRPHRTCYGMMNMIAETTKKDCEVPGSKMDTTILQNLQKFTEDKITSETTEEQIDTIYNSYISKVKTDSPSHYKYMCQGGGKPKDEEPVEEPQAEPACKVDCKVKDASNNQYTCTYTPENIKDGKPVTKDITVKDPAAVVSLEIDQKEFKPGLSGKLNCDATFPKDGGPDYLCKSADCKKDKDGDKYSCDLKISKKGSDQEIAKTIPGLAKSESLEVEVEVEPNKKVKLTCAGAKFPEEEKDDGDPDFELKKECGDQNCTVKLEKKGEVSHDGWSYIWKSENKPDGVKESWNAEKENEPKVAGGDDANQTGPAENVASITQARSTADYKVCASMKKGEKEIGPKCETIPKLGAKPDNKQTPPRPNYNLQGRGPVQPQIQIRGMSNTSADGIK